MERRNWRTSQGKWRETRRKPIGQTNPEHLASDVHAALAQSQELVGISLSDRYSRASETRKIRKRAKNMSREDATAAFLQAVADAEGAQANNQARESCPPFC